MGALDLIKSIEAPTSVRFPDDKEWKIVQDVFGDTLPWKRRILITNASGLDGAPFTIPTSLITAIGISWTGPIVPYLQSIVNVGYLVNVGKVGEASMAGVDEGLLVHEMTHVWQGYNAAFALSYVASSALNQCKGIIAAGSFSGRNSAYTSTLGKPWNNYNAEQQANIVEQWYLAGMPQSGTLWPYIKYNIRRGSDTGDVSELEGMWHVNTNGTTYYYWFLSTGTVKWFYKVPAMLTTYASSDGKGKWEVNGNSIGIKWESGSREDWNLPLLLSGETGTWYANTGKVHPITATKP